MGLEPYFEHTLGIRTRICVDGRSVAETTLKGPLSHKRRRYILGNSIDPRYLRQFVSSRDLLKTGATDITNANQSVKYSNNIYNLLFIFILDFYKVMLNFLCLTQITT